MRVAITGATGFTGGHTVRELLAAGHDPVALIRDEKKLEQVRKLHNLPKFDFVVGDITDTASIQKVIHIVMQLSILLLSQLLGKNRYL